MKDVKILLFKNNCGTSAIASDIVAPQACAAIIAAQVPTSACLVPILIKSDKNKVATEYFYY